MKQETIFLDLKVIDLYGWQGKVSKQKVESIMRGISAEDKFPLVKVYKIDERTYQLTKLLLKGTIQKDGGHTRAKAHYEANQPLECMIVGELPEIDFDWHMPMNIRDLVLNDDEYGQRAYQRAIKTDKNYKKRM